MKIITNVLRALALFATILFFNSGFAQTAEEGAQLFNANCTSCHAINEKVVGPALKDAHKRRDEKWLISWIKNSQKMVKAGDPIAVQIYKENNEALMTAFENLNDNQIKSVIAYIKAESEKPAAPATAASTGSSVSNQGASPVEVNANMRGKINWLLIIIAVLLFMVIALVLDILGLVGQIQGKPVINWNSINSKMALLFLIAGMGAVIWEFAAHTKLTVNSYDGASAHSNEYDSMFNITFYLTLVVFIITQILLFWYLFKYKHSKSRKALYFPDNHKLELIWTVIPAIVLTVLVIRGLKTWNDIMYHKDEKAQLIEVYGYQFGWNARYAGADNVLGKHDFREIGKVNALGVDPKDPKALDDVVTNELHLKVDQPVMLKFRAKDVIHSAYLPHFRVQMNVVPGLPTQFAFTPTITTADMRSKLNDPTFDYILLCNKICGGAHYRMKMKVIVHTAGDYEKWMSSQTQYVQNAAPVADTTSTQTQVRVPAKNNKILAIK